jgi:K+-sensing histidine kinase KdpD
MKNCTINKIDYALLMLLISFFTFGSMLIGTVTVLSFYNKEYLATFFWVWILAWCATTIYEMVISFKNRLANDKRTIEMEKNFNEWRNNYEK